MVEVIKNLLIIFLTLSFAFGVCWLAGNFLTLSVAKHTYQPVTVNILYGLGFWLCFLSLAHFFMPVESRLFLVLFSFCLFFISFNLRHENIWRKRCGTKSFTSPINFCLAIIIFFALVRALVSPPNNYDSFLYHFQIIEYLRSEKIIFGLGNLHTRLGFNSSIYSLASFFESSPWNQNGFRFANPFIILIACWEFLHKIRQLLVNAFNRSAIPVLIGVPIVLTFAFSNKGSYIASPSPDISAALLGVIAFGYFLQALDKRTIQTYSTSLFVSAIAVSFRPINIFIFIFSILLILSHIRQSDIIEKGKYARLLAPGVFFIFVHALHNFIVTGYPIYPLPLLESPVRWAVPSSMVRNDLRWIESWAKIPGQSPEAVLGNWKWLSVWWNNNYQSLSIWIVVCVSAVTVYIILKEERGSTSFRENVLLVSICVFPALLWFTKGPDIRLGFAQLTILAILPLLFLNSPRVNVTFPSNRATYVLAGVVIVLAAQFSVANLLTLGESKFLDTTNLDVENFQLPNFPLQESRKFNGVTFFNTENGVDQCGRIKWCSPYALENLEVTRHGSWLFFENR